MVANQLFWSGWMSMNKVWAQYNGWALYTHAFAVCSFHMLQLHENCWVFSECTFGKLGMYMRLCSCGLVTANTVYMKCKCPLFCRWMAVPCGTQQNKF